MSNIDSLREAVKLSPDNVPLLLLFAQALIAEMRYDEAVEAFDKVLVHKPGDIDASLGVARVRYIGRDYENWSGLKVSLIPNRKESANERQEKTNRREDPDPA